MKNDFDRLVDRRNSGNMKYIHTPQPVRQAGRISYAGAEMDFKTAPIIIEALTRKAREGIYGFTIMDEDYINAVRSWMESRRLWQVEPQWLVPTYGTLQSLAATIRVFTAPGDGVILQTPVYMRYNRVIELNQRRVVCSPLLDQGGCYEIDYADLEACMAERKNTLLVLCNPHNPITRVWNRRELKEVAALAKKYSVLIYSDEIFAEVVFPGHNTVPLAAVDFAFDNCIVATSLGKAFNFTGFSHANIIIPDARIRAKFYNQRNTDHYGSINPFIYAAVIAAYNGGHDWLNAMLVYVHENMRIIREFFARYLPEVVVAEPQGTFSLWINWRGTGMTEDRLHNFLVNEAFLDLDRGSLYGSEGTGFARMNVATPRSEIKKSLELLLAALQKRGLTDRA